MSWKSVWMFRFILRQPSLIWQSFTLNNIKFYKNRDNNNITKDTDNKQTVRPLYKPNFFKIFSLCEVTLARQWDSPVNLLFPILGKKKKQLKKSFPLSCCLRKNGKSRSGKNRIHQRLRSLAGPRPFANK